MGLHRRTVLLFAQGAKNEAQRKGLFAGRNLFRYVERRVAAAASRLGVDLVVVGHAGVGRAAHRLPQRGATFGDRLAAAFEDTRALGYDHIVAVGIDTPQLSHTDLAEAFRALERRPMVIGPSTDGGVYLIGLAAKCALPTARWQTGSVASDLLRSKDVLLLRELRDVDDVGGALELAQHSPELRALCIGVGAQRVRALGPEAVAMGSHEVVVDRIRGPPSA